MFSPATLGELVSLLSLLSALRVLLVRFGNGRRDSHRLFSYPLSAPALISLSFSALWVIGHLGLSHTGLQFLISAQAIPLVVELAETSPSLSLRGYIFIHSLLYDMPFSTFTLSFTSPRGELHDPRVLNLSRPLACVPLG